ncbi:uncharacterized protein RJT20DRAFT_130689 [Scheffersomyces xylosifermentans]|uniref:uncharacterized protein n=1 Tax=Scheffersomyces xylosifermentans TaxID=1304137 RepID=UPI00315C8433
MPNHSVVTDMFKATGDRGFILTKAQNAASFPINTVYKDTYVSISFNLEGFSEQIPLLIFNYNDIDKYTNLPNFDEFIDPDNSENSFVIKKSEGSVCFDLQMKDLEAPIPATTFTTVVDRSTTTIVYHVQEQGLYCIYIPQLNTEKTDEFTATVSIHNEGSIVSKRFKFVHVFCIIPMVVYIGIALSIKRVQSITDGLECCNLILIALYAISNGIGLTLDFFGLRIALMEKIVKSYFSTVSFIPFILAIILCTVNSLSSPAYGYFWILVSEAFLSIFFFLHFERVRTSKAAVSYQGKLFVRGTYNFIGYESGWFYYFCLVFGISCAFGEQIILLLYKQWNSLSFESMEKGQPPVDPSSYLSFLLQLLTVYVLNRGVTGPKIDNFKKAAATPMVPTMLYKLCLLSQLCSYYLEESYSRKWLLKHSTGSS